MSRSSVAGITKPSVALALKPGLDVTFISIASGKDALTGVIEGRSDIATVYGPPVVLQSHEGERLAIVSMLHNSSRNNALLPEEISVLSRTPEGGALRP